MARDLRTLPATREAVAAGIREGAMETAHHELAQVIAALNTERRLPAYLLPSLRRVETMLRADVIQELGDCLWARAARRR